MEQFTKPVFNVCLVFDLLVEHGVSFKFWGFCSVSGVWLTFSVIWSSVLYEMELALHLESCCLTCDLFVGVYSSGSSP